MKSLWVKDLSRSDDLDREQLLAVRGGIAIINRPPEEGPWPTEPQPTGFCGTGSPFFPGLPSLPNWPTLPGWPGCEPGPAGPCGPALDPRLQ